MSTSDDVVVRRPGEGRTLLVGGADYVTYKVSGAETDGSYFCFEVATSPDFGAMAAALERTGVRVLAP